MTDVHELLDKLSVPHYIDTRSEGRYLYVKACGKVGEHTTKMLRENGWQFDLVTSDGMLMWVEQ